MTAMPESIFKQPRGLGEVLSILMIRRQMNGIQVAEKAGITAPSFSRILNGIVRPRQGTLTKIMQALCTSSDEEQMVLSGYGYIPDIIREEPPIPLSQTGDIPASELERVARYMEIKSMSIDFMKSVSKELERAGYKYDTNASNGNVVTDFLIENGGKRIAVECKFNVNRDWEREVATARLLRKQLPCDAIVIVVPYKNTLSEEALNALKAQEAVAVALHELGEALDHILKRKTY
jgi:transcriptional regulator with XRE-family HTH domain